MQPSRSPRRAMPEEPSVRFGMLPFSGHFRLLSASFGGDAVDGEGLLAHLGRERAERKREMPRSAAPRLTPERWSDNDAAVATGNESMSQAAALARTLPAVPVVDVRDGGPPLHAVRSAAKARALRDACLRFFPRAALPLVPAFDRMSRNWLKRSCSPYVAEIADIAAALDLSGVWLLNASMQWGCTALAGEEDGAPWLVRTLDWPFKGLGHNTELAHMRGESGDFFSVTWPGYVGVLTAMAPQRFAACLNQAPMWRRTRHPRLRPFDFAANAVRVWSTADCMPPDQLLRRTFEVCDDYAAARRHAGNDAGLAGGDLHLGRLQAARALRHRAHRNRLRHPRTGDQRRQRLAADPAGLGRAHRHAPLSGLFVRRRGRYQPGAARDASRL